MLPGMCNILRVNFFQCRVFSTKSVQNLKSFCRSSQICFVFAFFHSLRTELHFWLRLTAEKHKALTKFSSVKIQLSLLFEIIAIFAEI